MIRRKIVRRKIGKPCLCKCGQLAKFGNKYIHGHHFRDKHHSEETIKRMSLAKIGKKKPEGTGAKMSIARKGKHQTEEHIKKRIESRRNNGKPWQSEESRKKIGIASTGRHHSEETKEKLRRMNIGRLSPFSKLWQDPVFREKQLKATFKAMGVKPTKPEKFLIKFLNEILPGEYKYVGNGSVVIGFKNPDFINANGQKKLIELFGDYWHSEKKTSESKELHESKRVNHFAKYGYKTLIIWQSELEHTNKLKEQLITFNSS